MLGCKNVTDSSTSLEMSWRKKQSCELFCAKTVPLGTVFGIKNFEKISEIKCPQTRSFVVTVVERKAIDLYRTKQRSSVIPFEEEFINVPAPSVMDAAVHRTDLGRVMAMLPTRYRELWFLKYDNGYSEREIAVMCSMTEANVKKTIQRAKKKLESILNGQEA
mgnify:CR=1 FL=1